MLHLNFKPEDSFVNIIHFKSTNECASIYVKWELIIGELGCGRKGYMICVHHDFSLTLVWNDQQCFYPYHFNIIIRAGMINRLINRY